MKGVLTYLRCKPDWNKNLLKKVVFVIIRYIDEKSAEIKFFYMRKHYLNMTPRFSRGDDLKKLDADIFMTGSDQVWGMMQNGSYDGAYFLSFVKDKPKMSYAASFGRTDFTLDVIKAYKCMLMSYNAISVREDSAAVLLREWGIPCNGQVLDPTLMLTADEWNKFSKGRIHKEFVLVYQIHNDRRLGDYAKRFADYVGLPLIRVSVNLRQVVRGGKFKWLPNLGEFLSYVKSCTYMVTDSFHGTAFAINFNRQFIEILPNNKTRSRNMSILNLTGLVDRVIDDLDDFTIADKMIDYLKVNAILDIERRKSKELLKSMIADCVNGK